MSQLFKRFRRDIIGLLWLSTGIFMAMALYSYNPSDPSFNSVGKSLQASNYCGYFGSFLADIFYQTFGLSSWVLVLGALHRAGQALRGIESYPGSLKWLWLSLLLITGSSLLALYWPELRFYNGQILVGGLIGLMVSKGLVGAFNSIGVQIILWTVVLALTMFFTEKSVFELFSGLKGRLSEIFHRFHESLQGRRLFQKHCIFLQE